MRLTINMVLSEGLIGWEIVGCWPLTLEHRGKKDRGGVRDDSFCFTPLLKFSAQFEVLYQCEEHFQSPRDLQCWKSRQKSQMERETEGNRSKGKNTNKRRNEWNGSGREEGRLGGKREEREKGVWAKVPPKTRHKSKMAWKHATFGLSVLLSRRGAKLFSCRAQALLSLDVLIVLISCCCSSITQKSQINHCVNINRAAESWRAGNSFREKEGIHTHAVWQTGQLENVLNLSISFKRSSHRIWGTDQIFTRCVICF